MDEKSDELYNGRKSKTDRRMAILRRQRSHGMIDGIRKSMSGGSGEGEETRGQV